MTFKKKLWIGILILTLLTPLGIIIPEKFKAGDAWGEWSIAGIEKLIGYIPAGMKENADKWEAPVSDYNLGNEESPGYVKIISYILSGVAGIGICIAVVYVIKRIFIKNE
jgi:cobalt/nickel transport protein